MTTTPEQIDFRRDPPSVHQGWHLPNVRPVSALLDLMLIKK